MPLNNLVLNINIFNIGYTFIAVRAWVKWVEKNANCGHGIQIHMLTFCYRRAGIFKIKHPFFLPLLFLLIYLSANSLFTRLTDENTTPSVLGLIGHILRPC